MGVWEAILVARLCVLTSVIHVFPQETESNEDSMSEQSPTHSAKADKKPGMLRSKVSFSLSATFGRFEEEKSVII